jgi:hypothetical protein
LQVLTDYDVDQVFLCSRGATVEAKLVLVSVSGLPVRETYPIAAVGLRDAAEKLGRWLAERQDVVSAHKARVRVDTARGLQDDKRLQEVLSTAFRKTRQR